MAFRRTPQGRWKEVGQMVAYSDGLGGQVTDVTPSEPADTSAPFRLEYRVSIPNFLDWSNKDSQLRIPLPTIGMPAGDPELEEGDDPIELGSPTDVTVRLKVTLPAKYVPRAPVPMGLKRDYAEYRSSYKVEGQVFLAERSLRFLQREVAAARARDYVNFTRAVDSDEAQTIRVTSTVAGTPAIPESAKADELFQAAGAALRNGNFKLAAEMLDRVVKLEPKHKRAWLILGSAHAAQQQYDSAVAAFQKQLEIDPYDEFANNGIGGVYLQQQKYEDAAAAFRKQLEIKPLDPTAQASLGYALHRLGKYEEAVHELEKAAVLDSKSADLRVNLGRAYLKLGKPEDALTAFDKAVELQPSTTTFNNVAYELSLANTNLDRAQQYAESAVAATAAQLRNISLTRLSNEDLQRVSSIAAYWDTLGWVHFQKGDLDKAEKYVEASWLLDFHGEVGDHLAQIYEKRGQKEKAIQQYARAQVATRPVAETSRRLEALLKKGPGAVRHEMKPAEEISLLRTTRLGALLKESASAEFFVLLAPGSRGAAVVEELKFIRGDEKLRPFADTLRSANYGAVFPDDTPTKLVRRGILSCGKDSGCSFVLLTPDSVNSVN
jgi:tetratricopeptide (TPR) repeat protein